MNYLDFDIEVGQGAGRDYPVRVLHSPAGEARETMHFPFDQQALKMALLKLENALLRSDGARRQALSPDQQAVQDFGQTLFETLLTGEVRARYDISLESAQRQDKGLRVRLCIEAPELAALPWEFLYDHRRAEFVCLSRDTPVVRYLQLPQPVRPLTVLGPLRILGMIASPTDLPRLDVDREKERVERATAARNQTGQLDLTWLEGQTWRDLQRAMRGGPWHVFHFIGHGGFSEVADEGIIFLADEDGRAKSLSASQLGRLLANHQSLRLVFLSACDGARGSERDVFSSTASILVRKGIPAVVAMQHTISDLAAINLARTFYEALADGDPVDAAVVEARVAVSLAMDNTVEWGTPVLHMRSPDGVLFELPARASEAPPKPLSEVRVPTSPSIRITEPFVTIDKPVYLELIRIPAGEFLMGSDPGKDGFAQKHEQPQHKLYLPEFYIGRYPITNEQYAAYMMASGRLAPCFWEDDTAPAGKKDHPVVGINWTHVDSFCEWLTRETGRQFRLPSEAEWEKAARGSDGRLYPWGNELPSPKLCNAGDGKTKDTMPVTSHLDGASPYGVLDMAGNALEMTRTLWNKRKGMWGAMLDAYLPASLYGYPYDPGDGREGQNPIETHVLRGGNVHSDGYGLRCAARFKEPDYSDDESRVFLGFRVVGFP